mmetsp:Transcript_12078/g.18180  ORF Transcript_12078/g.18180 Transcript_12078/m.18180 type:complete len:113 (-) Transcript_12078:159-497(-)
MCHHHVGELIGQKIVTLLQDVFGNDQWHVRACRGTPNQKGSSVQSIVALGSYFPVSDDSFSFPRFFLFSVSIGFVVVQSKDEFSRHANPSIATARENNANHENKRTPLRAAG